MIVDMHEDTNGDPAWFLAGVLHRQQNHFTVADYNRQRGPGQYWIAQLGQGREDDCFDPPGFFNKLFV